MKTLVTALLALATSLAIAQHHNSISSNINDNGKTLSIRINGTVDGKPIDYDRTFDVANLNKDERNALRERILDSLNIHMPKPPVAPHAPLVAHAPLTPVAPIAPLHSESASITSNDQSIVSVTNGDNQALIIGGKQPYTREVRYNSETGQLYLRYRFKKDGDDFTYERTVDAPNKSQQERQRIIADIEKSIGVPTTGK